MNRIQIMPILMLMLLLSFTTSAQTKSSENDVPEEIITALNKGDVNKLTLYLNNTVELVISGKNNIYNKQQASGILSDFFKKNSVKSFTVTHSSNKAAASFLIGRLNTSNGNFRIYILTRKANKDILIQQLRIESE